MSVWLQIFIAVAGSLFGFMIISLIKKFMREWRDTNRKREIYYIKLDCIVSGLKQMNGNTSIKFAQVYDHEFETKSKEFDLITK